MNTAWIYICGTIYRAPLLLNYYLHVRQELPHALERQRLLMNFGKTPHWHRPAEEGANPDIPNKPA